MEVVYGIRPGIVGESVVTIGMFDGVHRGHQALLLACREQARRLGLPSVVLTYHPHPTRILHPERPVQLLTPLPEKLDRLALYGMDYAVVAEFTLEFSRLTPRQFICDTLAPALNPRLIVVGYRTTFGHGRAGSAEVLRELACAASREVEVVPPIEISGVAVSSTKIRESLAEGNVTLASELLGYPYQLSGTVIPGDGRGRQLGFPTINLQVYPEKLVPASGVYAVDVVLPDATYRGAMFIGERATFDASRTIEVHILDFSGDLYSREVTIRFLKFLRDVQPFSDAEALIEQIRLDVDLAREA